MKKIKTYFALVLCCLMLCQTTVDSFPLDNMIKTYGHHDENFLD